MSAAAAGKSIDSSRSVFITAAAASPEADT
jgi:hypothetical protein